MRNDYIPVIIDAFFPGGGIARPEVEGDNPLFRPVRVAKRKILTRLEFDKGPGIRRFQPAEIVGHAQILVTTI